MSDVANSRPALRKGPDPAAEAGEWLARMTSGDLDDAGMARFARWIAEPANAVAYNDVERLWLALGPVASAPSNIVPLAARRPRLRSLQPRFAAMAASFLVAAFCSWQFVSVWQYDHAAGGTEIASVTLGDGSKVELNTGAAIDYERRAGTRHVTLAKGEAFFDVKRDAAHPFVIDAGSAEVRVLGTAFSVRRDAAGKGKVIVQRGKVRVTAGGASVDLVPDQAVAFGTDGLAMVRPVAARKALAWSRGVLLVEDRPLGEVLDEFDRYYPGVIVMTDAKAAKARINAVIEIDRIDGWLRALAKTHDVDVRMLPGVTIVSKADS